MTLTYVAVGMEHPFVEATEAPTFDAAYLWLKLEGWRMVSVVGIPSETWDTDCHCRSCTYDAAVVEIWPRDAAWVRHIRNIEAREAREARSR